MKYKFNGDYSEVFFDIGREVQPGEIVESDKTIDHPRLQLIEEKTKTTPKAEVSE